MTKETSATLQASSSPQQSKLKKTIQKPKFKPQKKTKRISISQPISPEASQLHQEIAEKLASSDKNVRVKSIRVIGNLLASRNDFTFNEFSKIWKAVLSATLLCNNILIEKDLIRKVASLVHWPKEQSITFLKAFFVTAQQLLSFQSQNKSNLDSLMEKVKCFIQLLLREFFTLLRTRGWPARSLTEFKELVSTCILPLPGFDGHSISKFFVQVFLQELVTVSKLKMPGETICPILSGFIEFMCCESTDAADIITISQSVFEPLLRIIIKEDFHNNEDEGLVQALSIVLALNQTFQNITTNYPSCNQTFEKYAHFLDQLCTTIHSQLEVIYQATLEENQEVEEQQVEEQQVEEQVEDELAEIEESEEQLEEIEAEECDLEEELDEEELEEIPDLESEEGAEDLNAPSDLEYFNIRSISLQAPQSRTQKHSRRVRFDESCNTYQDFLVYKKGLETPICLTPLRTPTKGLLKSPFSQKENIPSYSNLPEMTPNKQARHDKIVNRQQTPKKAIHGELESALYL